MYDLPYHKERDEQVIQAFIEQHPFAFLTGCDAANKPVATQVPLFLEEKEGRIFLSGHIMKNTDHHKAFLQNENVLAVFTGNHTYVSATWYSNPHLPEVLALPKSELTGLYDKYPEMQKIMRAFWEDVILHLLRRFTALQKDSAEKRYLDLLNQPMYLQRIPQKYLASYIGVTPTSLSRIRRKIR